MCGASRPALAVGTPPPRSVCLQELWVIGFEAGRLLLPYALGAHYCWVHGARLMMAYVSLQVAACLLPVWVFLGARGAYERHRGLLWAAAASLLGSWQVGASWAPGSWVPGRWVPAAAAGGEAGRAMHSAGRGAASHLLAWPPAPGMVCKAGGRGSSACAATCCERGSS
jgi:hypothetical protein